jgi:hypothetical protein
MIGSIREMISIQIGLSLSDEISYQEQMYLPSFFLLLLLASFSDSLFLFFAGADQLSYEKALKEAITCARERAAHGIARKKATASGTGINEIHNLQEHDASFISIIASPIILNLMLQICKGGIMIISIFVSGSH